MKTASILIADDHPLVRRGLRTLLETQPKWKVVAEVSNGREAVEVASTMQPDVAILDIGMPRLNGMDAAALIFKASPKTRILMLTMHSAEDLIQRTLTVGASGYVLKADAEKDLIAAVDALLHHKTFFTSAASDVILGHMRGRANRGAARRDPRPPECPRARSTAAACRRQKQQGSCGAIEPEHTHRGKPPRKNHGQAQTAFIRRTGAIRGAQQDRRALGPTTPSQASRQDEGGSSRS